MLEQVSVGDQELQQNSIFENFNEFFEEIFRYWGGQVRYVERKVFTDVSEVEKAYAGYPGSMQAISEEVIKEGFYIVEERISGLHCDAFSLENNPKGRNYFQIEDIFWNFKFIANSKKEKITEIYLRRAIIATYLFKFVIGIKRMGAINICFDTNPNMGKFLAQVLCLRENLDFKISLDYGDTNYGADFPKLKILNLEDHIRGIAKENLAKAAECATKLSKKERSGKSVPVFLRDYSDSMLSSTG